MSTVGKHMSTQIFSTSPDKFSYEAIDDMYKNRVSALLVEKEGEYIGIITKSPFPVRFPCI